MASTTSSLLCLCLLTSLISPIISHLPTSPCAILGDLLSFLGPCDVVVAPLAPCLGAMIFKSGKSNEASTKACCDGAAVVAKGRGTRLGKLLVCGCMKDAMSQISIITPQDLRGVLGNCSGVSLPVPNPNTSCVLGHD